MKLLAISGSLRKESYNTRVLETLKEIASDDVAIEIVMADLPLYDQDDDTEQGLEVVKSLKAKLVEADGVILTSPEYNYSFSGVLKNTIDWLSRPGYNSGFKNKPVAMITASMADTGGIRAQEALRPVLSGMLAEVYPAPAAYLAAVHEKYDEMGTLTDENTSRRLENYLNGFVDWINSRN